MAGTRLRRVDLVMFRSKSPADRTQVPLPFSRVDFYRQGATVSSATPVTIPSGGGGRPRSRFSTEVSCK